MLKRLQVLPCLEFSDNPLSISTPEQAQHNEAGTDIPSAPCTSKAVVEKHKRRLSYIDLLDQPTLSKPTKHLPEVPEGTKNRASRKKNSRIQTATASTTSTCSDL
jgi:hypothetical protein